jgi:nucleoside-diphosphate-sugar epimerase
LTTVAITGASGNLGSVLVERLIADSSIERIIAIDRRAPEQMADKVEFTEADVRDPDLHDAFAGCDAVVHLAYIVERGSRDRDTVQQVNVGGTKNVCEAAVRAGVEQIVYASSIAAYGFHPSNSDGEITEDAPCRGNDDFYYARTKGECERWLDEFAPANPKVAIARLRPSVFLGPRGGRSLEMLRRRYFPYLGGYGKPLHVTHEDDVAEAFYLALTKRAHGAFNVAASEPLAMSEWAKHTGKVGVRLPGALVHVADYAYKAKLSDFDPVWIRAGREHPILVSTKKIRRKLRWRPRFETTGAVLRELAGAPTSTASRGTKILFGSMATLTRVRGGLPVPPRGRRELKQLRGAANLVLTGASPSEWHFSFRNGSVGLHRGLAPSPRSTTIMSEQTLFELLSGDQTMAKAQFTGKIRVRGEGHYHLVVSGIISAFRFALTGEGLPARAFAKLVLRGGPAPAVPAHV